MSSVFRCDICGTLIGSETSHEWTVNPVEEAVFTIRVDSGDVCDDCMREVERSLERRVRSSYDASAEGVVR